MSHSILEKKSANRKSAVKKRNGLSHHLHVAAIKRISLRHVLSRKGLQKAIGRIRWAKAKDLTAGTAVGYSATRVKAGTIVTGR